MIAIENDRLSISTPLAVVTGSGLVALDVVISEKNLCHKFWAGGSCGNVMTILAYFGWTAYPIAYIGKDLASEVLINDISKWGTKTELIIRDKGRFTPIVVERIKEGSKTTHKFEFKCPFCGSLLPRNNPLPKTMAEELSIKLPSSNVFYFDRVSTSTLLIAEKQKAKGALIVFEPHRIVKKKIFKQALEIADIVKYSGEQIESLNSETVRLEIQTMSERGLRYRLRRAGANAEWKKLDAFRNIKIVDSAGAGDWCTAGLIHILGQKGAEGFYEADEKIIESALRFGQRLAALKCAYEGPRGIMYYIKKSDLNLMLEKLCIGQSFVEPAKQSLFPCDSAINQVCPRCEGKQSKSIS